MSSNRRLRQLLRPMGLQRLKALNTFLNAEGAKVSQRTQKEYQNFRPRRARNLRE